MAAPTRLPPKKDVALALLEQSTVYVHLDPRSEGVRVPDWFKKQPQLVLQIGLNMPVPIQDLDVGDEAVWVGDDIQQLHLRQGRFYLLITSQTGERQLLVARQIADRALSRLPKPGRPATMMS